MDTTKKLNLIKNDKRLSPATSGRVRLALRPLISERFKQVILKEAQKELKVMSEKRLVEKIKEFHSR